MSLSPRVLYVAMHHSIHTARWLKTANRAGLERHLFPLDPAPYHPSLRHITIYVPTVVGPAASTVTTLDSRALQSRVAAFASLAWWDPKLAAGVLWRRLGDKMSRKRKSGNRSSAPPVPPLEGEAPRLVPVPFEGDEAARQCVRLGRADESEAATVALHGPRMLADVIRLVRPDLVHSMEFQHAAYLVLAARDHLSRTDPGFQFPRWLATNWGSDIYLFGRDERHARQIRRVCESVDLYSCECHRDLELGRSFGYRGPHLPVLPNSGGIDTTAALKHRDPAPPSKRKVIMVKGYDHFAGRAMIALGVLERYAERLGGFEIVLFSVSARPRARALELKCTGALNIRIIDYASHEEILREFGRARIYMAISISDGISTSVLEAMLMGAFPIQTNTSCCQEWFIDGETGFAVPHDDEDVIAARFEKALVDDALVDDAAARNLDIVQSRIDESVLGPQIAAFYDQALKVCQADHGRRST